MMRYYIVDAFTDRLRKEQIGELRQLVGMLGRTSRADLEVVEELKKIM